MSDKDNPKRQLVFMTTQGPENYITLNCKKCGQPWIFNKQLILDVDAPLNWECVYCRRGFYYKEDGSYA